MRREWHIGGLRLTRNASNCYMRLQYRKLLLVLASLVMSFSIGEIALHILADRFHGPSEASVPKQPGPYEEFLPYGYRLRPSRSTSYLYPNVNPRKLSLVSNSDGFRSSREFDQHDGRVEVIFVGDSFVFGQGVEESERFVSVLERLQPTWRVDGLAMPGWGPDLMLRALEAVGLELHPSMVVFCIYADDIRRVNPYYRGSGFRIPRFRMESERLVTTPYLKVRSWEKLHLFQVGKWIDNVLRVKPLDLELNAAILDRFLELAGLHGFEPAIVFLPAKRHFRGDKKRRDWLQQYSESNGIPFLDLTHVIQGSAGKAFIPRNPHYNPYGHQIVAAALHRLLIKHLP